MSEPHQCPVCNGHGNSFIRPPPWLAGDQPWPPGGTDQYRCRACNGTGIVWDWKTAGRQYESWEKERWAIQPSVYTWAACHEWPELNDFTDPHTFTYAVMLKNGSTAVQILDVERHQGHWNWMIRQARAIANMVRTNENGPWPLMDHGWHCSPKWCGAWDACKGAELEGTDAWWPHR